MMQSIICLICVIKTWITGMSNPVVGFIVAQGEIAHEVFNRGNGNDHWILRIAREKYAVSASRLVIIVSVKNARIFQRGRNIEVTRSPAATAAI